MPNQRYLQRIVIVLVAVVLTGASAEQSWFQVRGGDWVVDAKTLTSLQGTFKDSLLGLARRTHQQLLPFSRYRFQFQGQFSSGRKVVAIFGFCDDLGRKDLTEFFLAMLDGGQCFFGVTYSPDSGQLTELYVEGTA